MTKSVRTMEARLERVEAECGASQSVLPPMSHEQMLDVVRQYADELDSEGENEQAQLVRAFVDKTISAEGLRRLADLSGLAIFLDFVELLGVEPDGP